MSAPAVYTLVVQAGRRSGGGLPAGATGAGLLCYASARDEAEAVRETVALLKAAGPGAARRDGLRQRRRTCTRCPAIGRRAGMMARAAAEHAVVVAEITPVFD